MPKERLPMRRIRDFLRLHGAELSKRRIAQSLNIVRTAVRDYVDRHCSRKPPESREPRNQRIPIHTILCFHS
jgi:hypothetical protein